MKMHDVWWQQILMYSPQDQISFPYACSLVKLKPKLLSDGKPHSETSYYRKWPHAGGKSHYGRA